MDQLLIGLVIGFVIGSLFTATSSVWMITKHPILCWVAANTLVQKVCAVPRKVRSWGIRFRSGRTPDETCKLRRSNHDEPSTTCNTAGDTLMYPNLQEKNECSLSEYCDPLSLQTAEPAHQPIHHHTHQSIHQSIHHHAHQPIHHHAHHKRKLLRRPSFYLLPVSVRPVSS